MRAWSEDPLGCEEHDHGTMGDMSIIGMARRDPVKWHLCGFKPLLRRQPQSSRHVAAPELANEDPATQSRLHEPLFLGVDLETRCGGVVLPTGDGVRPLSGIDGEGQRPGLLCFLRRT